MGQGVHLQRRAEFHALSGIVLAFILFIAQATNAAAINDQGLQWGINVGDRFDYHVELDFSSSTANVSIDDMMYVIAKELNAIPDHAMVLSDLTVFSLSLGSYTTFWQNSTLMDSLWLDVIGSMNPFVVYPIGNWSLLTQILEDAAPAVTTQTTTTMNYSLIDYPVAGNVHETVFLKSNGVPISHVYIRTWDSEKTLLMNLTLMQTPSGTNVPPILILGSTFACILLVAAVIVHRRWFSAS